eukprot:3515571-Amphidinium_carterae.1
MFRVSSWGAVESASIDVEGAVLTVSMDCMWFAHEQVAVYGGVRCLRDIVEELTESDTSKAPQHTPSPAQASSSSQSTPHPYAHLPWMRGLIAAVEGGPVEHSGTSSVVGPSALDSSTLGVEPDAIVMAHGETEKNGDTIDTMFRALGEEQLVFKDTSVLDDSCFTMSLLGEARKMERTGDAVAGVKASIRLGTACEAWARSYNLQLGSRFEVSKYSQIYATKLARAWIHRMSFLYALYCNGDKENPYEESKLQTYEAPQDLKDCLDNLKGAARNRAIAVRDIMPR